MTTIKAPRKATRIDAVLFMALRPEIQLAVADVALKYNLSIKVGNGSYGYQMGCLKLDISQIDEKGEVVTKEWLTFADGAQLVGLDPAMLGRIFTLPDGDKYRVMGLSLSRQKAVLCFRLEGSGKGKNYWLRPEHVLDADFDPPEPAKA